MNRRAFTLVEVLVGSVIALLGTGIYVMLQMQQARQDADVDQRLAALCEARAVLEAQRARPFLELAVASASLPVPPLRLPGQPSQKSPFWDLPGAAIQCKILPYPGGHQLLGGAVQIEVEATWTSEGHGRKLQLVTVRTDAWPLEEL